MDAIVTRQLSGRLQILLVTRGRPPFEGCLALPGGFVDDGESPQDAVLRELREECGMEGANPRLADVRGEPGRDPRKHVVSIIYRVEVSDDAQPVAGDDAAEAAWFDLDEILASSSHQLAFDHAEILYSLLDE